MRSKTYRTGALLLGLGLVAAGPFSYGQDGKPEVSFNGFFDGYYASNFNSPKPTSGLSSSPVSAAAIPPANNTYRYYDTYHNQLTLNLAELTVKAAYDDVSFLVDFDFGPFADLNASSSSPSGAVVDESSKNIGQAVVTYKPKNSRFTFDIGKMYSHLGVETVKSKDNFNYSRSILFSYALPFWHTGAHVGYDLLPGKLQTGLYVYNGWNTQYDVNRSKTLGAQIRWTPSEAFALVYNFIGGPERADSESDMKTVHELNVSATLSGSTTLIADAVYGAEENAGPLRIRAQWSGALLGLRFQIDDVSFFSPRFEVYRDQDGSSLGGTPQTIESVTLTYGKEIAKGFETRLEARGDFSNESSFAKDVGTANSQTTVLVAGLLKF